MPFSGDISLRFHACDIRVGRTPWDAGACASITDSFRDYNRIQWLSAKNSLV